MTRLPYRFALTTTTLLLAAQAFASVLESFTVTTQNVEVREMTESSIQLRSQTYAYNVKLEPNHEGKVTFALSGIGYASTARFTNLLFGVKIMGYRDGQEVAPMYNFDDVNKDIVMDHGRLIFKQIYGTLPVWFNEQVDSIQLAFSNSHSVNVDQYLGILDLRIMQPMQVMANPEIEPCRENLVMIAIDGSSSIDRKERTRIGNQLLDFARKSNFARDSNQLCVLEYGTRTHAILESSERRSLVSAMLRYKKHKNNTSKITSWTNWSVAFDEALQRSPDVFIFITDGWSNWKDNRACSFSAQYEDLVTKANLLKEKGTRLLFVTSDMDTQQNASAILGNFLNGNQTRQLYGHGLVHETDLSDVDLVTMQDFIGMDLLNFSSLLVCPLEIPEIIPLEDPVLLTSIR